MQKDSDACFWKRMDVLIGDERPYPWAEKVGINRSAFQSSRTRGKKPLPKTVKAWAEKVGCSYEWLNTGKGEPFSQQESTAVQAPELKQDVQQEIELLDAALLEQAFQTLAQALTATNKVMQPSGTSRFIAAVYASLKENEEMDTEVLKDCILTVEEALKETRRVMSPKSKTQLIQVVYEIYSGNASYKEAMTKHIDQLIKSVS